MDEEYSESVDTSADIDVADTDVADEIPADIPDDVPEDIPEDDYSDSDVADDVFEDVTDDAVTDEAEYDNMDDSIEEDSLEPDAEEIDESADYFEEDSYDNSEIPSEDDEEIDDIPEDSDGIEEAAGSEVGEIEDIPEDTGSEDDAVQDGSYEDELPEDVTDAEATDETADAEDTDITEQPEDVTDTEAMDETVDVEDTDTAEQSENQGNLETYDYETSPETQDTVNPETSGEFVSAENPYQERWEKFGEEFSDDSETGGWDSLKDVPFSGDKQVDPDESIENTDADVSVMPSETEDVDNAAETSEINSISDYMNAHNYGPDDFSHLTGDERRDLEEETGWSKEIVEKIDTAEQADIYKKAELTEEEINDRKCLVKDIDLDYTDPKTGKTNRELMALGRPPFDSTTGERIELHHMGQEYDNPFAELCENSEHGDGNDAVLHNKNIDSWRQDDKLKNRYNNVDRPKHWTERLKRIEGEG